MPMETIRREIPQTDGRLLQAFGGVLAVFIGLLAPRKWLHIGRRSEQVERTDQVIDGANAFVSSLQDAEAGQASFRLTGKDRHREAPMRVDG